MVFNCKPISEEMPHSVFNAYRPFDSDKSNNPDEEAIERVSFFLIVHGCSSLTAVELFVKGIEGVESVKCDGNSKLEVTGTVRPVKIQEMVKNETEEEVELIFPSTEIKEVRDERKGTKGKYTRRVIPIPGNDVGNEKIGQCVINLKIKLCCESCNKNLEKTLKMKGLEMLNIEPEKDLVTVRGTVQTTELISYIKDKLNKDIEVVNVTKVMAPSKKDDAVGDKDRDTDAIVKKYKGKSGGNRREEEGYSIVKRTVVLKIRLHCGGCTEKIQKVISNCRGVETVSTNVAEDLVTVKGTMDVQELTYYLKEKLKRNVEVVLIIEKDKKGDCEKKDKYST